MEDTNDEQRQRAERWDFRRHCGLLTIGSLDSVRLVCTLHHSVAAWASAARPDFGGSFRSYKQQVTPSTYFTTEHTAGVG